MKTGRTAWRAVLVVGLAAALAPAAGAQGRTLEVTPLAGGYVPIRDLGPMPIPGTTIPSVEIEGSMKPGTTVGGRLGLWVAPKWGVEATYFYSTSDLGATQFGFRSTIEADLQGGMLQAFYQASDEVSGSNLVVRGGVMGIRHAGLGFQLVEHKLDLGLAGGGGIHIILSEQVTLRLDADLLAYNWDAGPDFDSSVQTDLLLAVGFGIRLSR